MKLSLMGAALFAIAMTANAATGTAQKDLKIATEAGYPPFEYHEPNGDFAGFDVDIGNELCKRMNRKCVWMDQAFDGLIAGLQARKFDLANSTMTDTEAREKVIDFTVPLYFVPMKLVRKKGSNLEPTAESLKGKRVGVQSGTTLEVYANQAWAPHGVTIKSYPSYTDAYTDLASGRLDATFQQGQNAVTGFLSKPAGAGYELAPMTLDAPILNRPIAMGMRKGNTELKTEVDKALKSMLADGTIQGFSKKYFQPGNIVFSK